MSDGRKIYTFRQVFIFSRMTTRLLVFVWRHTGQSLNRLYLYDNTNNLIKTPTFVNVHGKNHMEKLCTNVCLGVSAEHHRYLYYFNENTRIHVP